jgi:pSer/pThr/pTyr-binding forkhead associated (FHA) protein
MYVQLTIIDGPARTASVRLKKADTLVGRQKGCDIRIPSNEISRRHCILSAEHGTVVVEDLNSANGTYLNGERISGRQKLKAGDRLRIGTLTFRIDVVPDAGASVSPEQPKHDEAAADDSKESSELIYRFAGDKRPVPKKDIEIDLDSHFLDGVPQGEEFRDFLRGMDR